MYFVLEYMDLSQFIAIDGDQPADGFIYIKDKRKAVQFSTLEIAKDYINNSGPPWLIKMNHQGLIAIIPVRE